MKKLDVLLMVLSCLFPIAGVMKQFPLTLSLVVGGLLFFISLGSYFAKQTNWRVFSWIAYAVFITFLLLLRNPYITTSFLLENMKISACIAIIPFLFRFRTYAITIGLLGLWAFLLWDVKQVGSLEALQHIMYVTTSEQIYLLPFGIGFLFGGWLGHITKPSPKREKERKPNKPKQKKQRKGWNITIPIPRLPKFGVKVSKSRRYESPAQQTTRSHDSKQEENMEQYRSAEEKQDIETEFIHEETRETRMGRRKKKANM
ncbi:DUF3959 family protein [Ectobacillus funiculus]|uniref:DUF3959 family protein n=1 Tax=Ectobacillus funiculus TaxID=137993 RepID=A0ABV5WBT4_9BACI